MEEYPEHALEQGIVGRVIIECTVGLDTRLACNVAEETPRNWGFGPAALRLADIIRMSPAQRNGQAVAGGRVRIPMRFIPAERGENSLYARMQAVMPPEGRVDLPLWEEAPTIDQVVAAYPAAARAAGVLGRGLISCVIGDDRRLRDCRVEGERPDNQGFGAAALTLAPLFRVAAQEEAFIQAHRGQRIFLPVHFGGHWSLTPLGTLFTGRTEIPFTFHAPMREGQTAREATATVRCVMATPHPPACTIERQEPANHPLVEQVMVMLQDPNFSAGFVPGDVIVLDVAF